MNKVYAMAAMAGAAALLVIAVLLLAQTGKPPAFLPNQARLPAIDVILSTGSGFTGWHKTIYIRDNGSVDIEEKGPFGGNLSARSYRLADSELLELKKLVNGADVFSFNDTYNCEPKCPTDYPSSSIRFVVGGKEKTVSMYVPQGMPPALTLILQKVRDVEAKFEADTAGLDTDFQLRAGQTAVISYGSVRIMFLNVTEDSRCPSDVKCVWAGQATVVVNILKNGQDLGNFNLTSGDLAARVFDGYSIRLVKVEPYPKTGARIPISDYAITLHVSKNS